MGSFIPQEYTLTTILGSRSTFAIERCIAYLLFYYIHGSTSDMSVRHVDKQ
jgi:hypothetical protein